MPTSRKLLAALAVSSGLTALAATAQAGPRDQHDAAAGARTAVDTAAYRAGALAPLLSLPLALHPLAVGQVPPLVRYCHRR